MLLFISMFINMFIFRAITAMVLESAITTRLEGRLICMCGIINGKNVFLVWPLRLAQVLHDGSVFLIMGMTMPAILRAQCW